MKITILYLFVILFSITYVKAQDLSLEIANGNIEKVMTQVNQSPDGSKVSKSVSLKPENNNMELNLRIDNNIAAPLKIHVYDRTGLLCQTHEIKKDDDVLECDLNIAELPLGVYFLEINLGRYKTIQKIQKI